MHYRHPLITTSSPITTGFQLSFKELNLKSAPNIRSPSIFVENKSALLSRIAV